MSRISSILRFAGKTFWIGIRNILGFALMGFIVNLILLMYLPNICELTDATSMFSFSNIGNCTGLLVVSLLFLIIFPIAYIYLGYKYAIQSTIHRVYVKNKGWFYDLIVERLFQFLGNKTTSKVLNAADAGSWISGFFEQLDKVPRSFRLVINTLKPIVPFVEIAKQISTNAQLSLEEGNSSEFTKEFSDAADAFVEDELLQPDLTLPIALLIINLGVFGIMHLLY